MKKVRTANSKTLEFKNKEEMWQFLFSIKEILVPYSEATIYTGKINPDQVFWMKKGIKINCMSEENWVDILVKAEDFRRIEHLFNKERLNGKKYIYIFKGFEEAWA